MNYYVYIKVKSRSRKVDIIKNLKRWKITSGTRGSPVDDAFCIFLWNSSIKELCCVVRRVRCCVRRVRCCVISCAVLPVAWCCAISYVVTLFEVTRVRCKTLEGVRAKRKRPKPPLCLSWTQPLCTARRESSHAPCVMAFSICRNVYV